MHALKAIAVLLLLTLGFTDPVTEKIRGVNFSAPAREPAGNPFGPIVEINADWVSVIPYALAYAGKPEITFDHNGQWWGEGTHGVKKTIVLAKEKGLKVMLKPHIWVRGQGWAGDFECENEEDWKKWEVEYENYVMWLVDIAQEQEIEMICIGTEYRKAVQQRSAFWLDLIRRIRKKYSGKLTYAANWDNYEKVGFWDELDYIGVDVYFPLTDKKMPSVKELEKAWQPYVKKLKHHCEKHNKLLLLTEYGYCSTDYPARRPWEELDSPPNMKAQMQAYEGLYRSLWEKDWVAGGFLWKWFSNHDRVGGISNKGFTPQNKPVTELIKTWYGR